MQRVLALYVKLLSKLQLLVQEC